MNVNKPFDFAGMVAGTDHRDSDLLAKLARLTDIREQVDAARRRGSTAFRRVMLATCCEYNAIEREVAATPVLTPEGRRAKALHALRDADPDAPSGGFVGVGAVTASALWDIVQAGAV